MNATIILLAVSFTLASPGFAEDPKPRLDTPPTPAPKTSLGWDNSPAHWDRLLSEKHSLPELRLGSSDIVMSGPLITGFQRQKFSTDRSPGQKFIGLPVIRLFVPQRMPSPPETGGKYIAWSEKSSRPWSSVSGGIPAGSAFSPYDNEPHNGFIFFRLRKDQN
jgi:hypothetical protein